MSAGAHIALWSMSHCHVSIGGWKTPLRWSIRLRMSTAVLLPSPLASPASFRSELWRNGLSLQYGKVSQINVPIIIKIGTVALLRHVPSSSVLT
jgi:hypothetical protein